MSLNRVTIIGNLGQDPEIRQVPKSQQSVANFSVATDESFTGKDGNRQERVQWHHIVVYGELAESCGNYLKKGRQVYVEGRLQTRDYEDRNRGTRRYRTEIIAQRVQFLGTKPEGPGGEAERPADDDIPLSA